MGWRRLHERRTEATPRQRTSKPRRPSGSSAATSSASTCACPGPARRTSTSAVDGVRRALEDRLDRAVAAVAHPAGDAAALGLPAGAVAEEHALDAPRGARPGGGRVARPCQGTVIDDPVSARSTLAAELEAAGGVGAPPTARPRGCARCSPPPLRHGRDELGKPRSGYGSPVEVGVRRPGRRCCSRAAPVDPGLRADPEAAGERAWLLVAAAVAALVDLACPGPPATAADLALRAGECAGGLLLGLPRGAVEPAELAEFAAARLRRARRPRSTACAPRRVALPAGVLDDAPALREPIGAGHPLRVAEAVARLGGEPADPGSVDARGGGARAARRRRARTPCARTRTPTRPAASRAGSSSASTGWASGAATTPTSPTSRAASPATSARSPRTSARRCSTPGLLAEKPSVGQRHVFLNPRRARDIHAFIETRRRRRAGLRLPLTMRRTARHVAPRADRRQVTTKSTPSPRSPRPGSSGPSRPDRLLRTAVALVRWGPTPAAGYTRLAAALPRRDRRSSTSSGTLTFREIHERTNALAHALADAGIERGRRRRDHVPQPPRLHRGGRRLLEARRQRAVPQHRLLRPAADRRRRAREARGAHLRRGVRRGSSPSAGASRKRYIAWHEPDERVRGRAARGPDRGRATART